MLLTSIDMKLDASPTARSHCFVRDLMALNKIKLFPAKRFGFCTVKELSQPEVLKFPDLFPDKCKIS